MSIHVDWLFVLMVFLPCCAAWAWLGFEICRITHKQRGIEVDRPVTDVLPDFVPDDWAMAPQEGE